MRLIVARCEVAYFGRTSTALPEAVRLLMLKADGTFMVWADGGGPSVKPLNWMSPPTVLEEERQGAGTDAPLARLVVRKQREDERLEISLVEVLHDVAYELDAVASLEKQGIERELQQLLAEAPEWCGEGFRLVRREWPTDIGPVDLMCRDDADEWVAVEIKRIWTRGFRESSIGGRFRSNLACQEGLRQSGCVDWIRLNSAV
jgi:endonuclease